MLTRAVLLLPLMLIGGSAYAGKAAEADAPWCAVNPSHPRQGQSVKLSDEKLHVVSASEQAAAKARLANKIFVKITEGEATALTGARPFSDRNIYLVRASAFYVGEDYSIKSKMAAFVYPDAHLLDIVNDSLSRPGTVPTNLAVVLGTDLDIDRVEVTCHTAA
ncbi:MAG TPA: hypothetical protein VNW15_04990 [Rhizomicrobium sp.]|jgi:hypothetical protein|nr:hypothetical protein [Rhizomicrobium sp.]